MGLYLNPNADALKQSLRNLPPPDRSREAIALTVFHIKVLLVPWKVI